MARAAPDIAPEPRGRVPAPISSMPRRAFAIGLPARHPDRSRLSSSRSSWILFDIDTPVILVIPGLDFSPDRARSPHPSRPEVMWSIGSDDQHGVAVAEEAVSASDGLGVGVADQVDAGQGAD